MAKVQKEVDKSTLSNGSHKVIVAHRKILDNFEFFCNQLDEITNPVG